MHSSENLLDTLTKLFPHGVTTTHDMATRLCEAGIGDIALSEMRILSPQDGQQKFVIAYLGATWITQELEVREGGRRNYEIQYCLNMPSDSLQFLVLSEHLDARLEPGKISPFDIERLPVQKFTKATLLIAECVQSLAKNNIDMILPQGSNGFEIVPTSTVIEQLQKQLGGEWDIVFAYGAPNYGFETPV